MLNVIHLNVRFTKTRKKKAQRILWPDRFAFNAETTTKLELYSISILVGLDLKHNLQTAEFFRNSNA